MASGLEKIGNFVSWGWEHKSGVLVIGGVAGGLIAASNANFAGQQDQRPDIPGVSSYLQPGKQIADNVTPDSREIDWSSGFALNSDGTTKRGKRRWEEIDLGVFIVQRKDNMGSFKVTVGNGTKKERCVVNFRQGDPSMIKPPKLICILPNGYR